jgi:hypothetical protein
MHDEAVVKSLSGKAVRLNPIKALRHLFPEW